MRRFQAAALLCLTVLFGSCRSGEPAPGTPSSVLPLASRSLTASAETLWIRGSTASESLFTDPWHVAALREGVVVVDIGRGLLAFSDSGAARWSAASGPAKGAMGPVTALDDSTVVVVRSDNGTLRNFDANGRERLPARETDARDVRGVCALDARTLLLAGGPDQLATVDRDGGTPRAYRYPWPALRDSASLLRQTVLASSPGRRGCVIALAVGEGFAITRGGDSTTLHPFVERIDLPPVDHTVETAGDRVTTTTKFRYRATAAASVAADDASIYIAFGGATPRRLGLIDIYDRDTGHYRGSLEFGAPIVDITAGRDAVYVQYLDSGVPALAALRIQVAAGSPPDSATPEPR
jgi:hypothetical protein